MNSDTVLGLSSKGFHRIRYYDWGDRDNTRVVICVHGLTRNGRDFDYLAQALSREFRIVCPDIAGRGQSDWLESKQDYGYVQYMADMNALVARVTAGAEKKIYWVGTSMGGLLGIIMAAMPNNPIRKLVVNDAGPLVPKAALERLAHYVGKDPRFPTIEAIEAHVRHISAPFGALSDEQWRHLTVHNVKQYADGTWGFRYDPAIANPFNGELNDIDLSPYWDAVRCPTLVLRGAESDILLRKTAEAMTQRGPKAQLVEFENIGHAPVLMTNDQVCVVGDFLLQP
ncbi:MAG TPA: alpha/beta hydrolase [Burkholderiales bacterium]|jgi:pimeloyl-ACP methyl ester carboxylesterase